ncbi:uncharacterized protein [Epargyreus clarus]|uniref:uncharacterized protein isoform X2 n=1 Tax=Epargyreus clarus TaxID=520877 RepID=UPI003C2E8CD3
MGGEASVIILLMVMVTTNALDINITKTWKPNYGWEVTCLWDTYANDTLQSVRLSNNGNQFIIYRPEKHGSGRKEEIPTPDTVMTVDCKMTAPDGQKGICVLGVEPSKPPRTFVVNCEVSGERPTFRIGDKEVIVRPFVSPSNATIVSTVKEESQERISLNCSSTGLPAPDLLWTVGDDKVQADFTGRLWNATTKLWHVWSFLAYTPTEKTSTVVCSTEVTVNKESFHGIPAAYNSVSSTTSE